MPDQELLEKYPLYRKFKYENPPDLGELKKPAIHMDCPVCKSGQTFKMSNEYHELFNHPNIPAEGAVVRAAYACASCGRSLRYFFLKFDPKGKYVMKVGQEPPWDITPDRTLEKMLGAHAEHYKKGLICESQSYGIGAFAYYRRIVEEIIDDLLAGIADLMGDEDRERYLEALEETKKTKVAQEKISLVKDLLPPLLRPGGMNPLSTLHEVLSEGLHMEPEERCLELAMGVREVLVFLVNQIEVTRTAASDFTKSMRRLLDRRKKPTV